MIFLKSMVSLRKWKLPKNNKLKIVYFKLGMFKLNLFNKS